jgi:hypothetical protein
MTRWFDDAPGLFHQRSTTAGHLTIARHPSACETLLCRGEDMRRRHQRGVEKPDSRIKDLNLLPRYSDHRSLSG